MSTDLIIKDTGVIARAELDVQINTAKAYPRDINEAMAYAEELATADEETAQSCFYCLPRKDKDGNRVEIKGASIRLAEIMATAWGNIHAASRIIENDGRHITAEGVAWDLQRNTKMSAQNKVSIWFGEKNGKGGYQANNDMQTMLANAASAKAIRNAIFKVVPKARVNVILEKAMKFSIGDQKTLTAKATEVLGRLIKMGINKDELLSYYDCKTISDITSDICQSMIGIGVAIKEGHIKIDNVFKSEMIEDNSKSASEKMDQLLAEKKQKRED
jgi:hypothetical protein